MSMHQSNCQISKWLINFNINLPPLRLWQKKYILFDKEMALGSQFQYKDAT